MMKLHLWDLSRKIFVKPVGYLGAVNSPLDLSAAQSFLRKFTAPDMLNFI